jgi:hypothetical protein
MDELGFGVSREEAATFVTEEEVNEPASRKGEATKS